MARLSQPKLVAQRAEQEGYVVIGVISGLCSTRKGSNVRFAIDAYLNSVELPGVTVDSFKIIPAAKVSYRSQGYKNVVALKPSCDLFATA